MKTVSAVILGLAVLVVLAAALTKGRHPSAQQIGTRAGVSTNVDVAIEADGPKVTAKQFSWREIESADYVQYVRNLRKIGCPEPTVEDIVVADVNALYMEKAKPVLEDLRKALAGYYSATMRSTNRDNIIASATARLGPLNGERLGFISKLLQHEVEAFKTSVAPWASALEEIVANRYPYLSAEKAEKVQALQRDSRSRLKALEGKSLNSADLRFADENQRAFDRELSALLSPEEYQRFVANESMEADELRRKLKDLAISDSEFMQLLAARREISEKYGNHYTSPELAPERILAEQKFRDLLGGVLGSDRYEEYQQQNDPSYRAVQDFAQSSAVPAETANALYSFGKELEDEFRAIAAGHFDFEMTQQKKLDAVQRADGRLNSLLDENARSAYLNSPAGAWFNKLKTSGEVRIGRDSVTAPIGFQLPKP
jgi:hypothetical protein